VVSRTPSFWPIFAMFLTNYAVVITILGLWGGPYLAHVYGYDLETRGFYLLVLALSSMTAAFAWGAADRVFGSYRMPVLIGALLTLAMLIWISLAGKMSPGMLFVWFLLYGLVTGYPPLLVGQARSMFPRELVGRGLTLLNLATMGGVFFFQFSTGAVIAWIAPNQTVYPFAAYQAAFALQAVLLALSIVCYLLARDRDRSV
jgi:MFS family permease